MEYLVKPNSGDTKSGCPTVCTEVIYIISTCPPNRH